jgi:hypothetical protein
MRCGSLWQLHIAESMNQDEVDGSPHIRHALAQWRLLDENDSPMPVGEKLGIRVAKVGLEPQDLRSGLMGFLDEHPSDLLVLATHGRDGIARWMHAR